MSKDKANKITLLGSDGIETPEEIIALDKNEDRKKAFQETYKRIVQIIPGYFMNPKGRRKNSSSGGGSSFTQNIIVTSDNVKVETKESVENKELTEDIQNDRERDD